MNTSKPINETDYFAVSKVAKFFKVHSRRITQLIEEHQIHHIRRGKRVILVVPAVIRTYLT